MVRLIPFATATLIVLATFAAQAHDFQAGVLKIGHPWSRATPKGAAVGAGYLTVTNNGSVPDRLVSVSVPGVADKVEVHEMSMKDGVMAMRPASGGLIVPPGGTLSLAPGGYHLMLMGLKAALKEGDRLKGTLVFEKAGSVDVVFNVEGMNAQHPPPDDKTPGMSDHKM
ncbi:MAG: copper chaperone PCu(A)C [Pseudolabrys sp.]|nr:copper chaperone PCu(A)C [Pseudolabrys sp.]